MSETKMECGKTTHRKPDDMRGIDRKVVKDRRDIVCSPGLGIGFHAFGNVRWRIAARCERNRTIAPAEMPHLRFPAAVVAGKLMNKYDGRTAAGFLEVQIDSVVRYRLWHVSL